MSTKLRSPRVPSDLVARPRLLGRLERDAGRKLTLLSAPAGFGKTTLLGEWVEGLARGGRPAAWVSLDEGDNDTVRFVSYLVAALGTVGGEGFGGGVVAALRSAEPPRMEAVLGALVNEVADLPGEVTVVLDDYHLIDSEAVHTTVAFLLERLPESAHLVLSGRVDPPLPLARLRARGQMAELHAPDLRFTPEEAAAFLGDAMNLSLSAEDAAALGGLTEGWVAALRLAALSLRDRRDVTGFVRSFSGGHRDVFDFLAEEVLEGQPEPVQSFLLETSVLGNLSGPLCDAVTGRDDGRRVLDGLERDNLLVVPLDDERIWYRYHHLFADFLRGRLEREQPGISASLHRKASGWCEENGLTIESVDHALRAGDHERAARLMERGLDRTWYRGEVVTLLGWLRALPEEALRRKPLLMVWYAAVLMLEGRLDGIEPLLDEAENVVADRGKDPEAPPSEAPPSEAPPSEAPPSGDPQHVVATAAAVRSLHASFGGKPLRAIEHARRALELLPEDNLNPRPFACLCLAEAYRAAEEAEPAIKTFAEAARLGRMAGHDYIFLTAMGTMAQLRQTQGRLREADVLLRQALGFAVERGVGLMPAVGRVRIGLGELFYERDELDAAERELALGAELAERAGELGVLVRGHAALSRVRRARGDTEGALASAHEAERLAHDSGAPGTISEAALWKARLHLMLDNPRAASDPEFAPAAGAVSRPMQKADVLRQARLLIASDDHDGALHLLDRTRDTSEASNGLHADNEIEILKLRALALWANNARTRSTEVVGRALSLAEPEGYVRTFVDEGPVMAALLSELLGTRQRGGTDPADAVSVHYLRKLLVALERDTTDAASTAQGLPEPLSERELEVLQLVAAGRTNRQIAQDLFVSLGTVKTHVNNVYRKLDSHSRTQAVARARELNLL